MPASSNIAALFAQHDKNGDGVIDKKELFEVMTRVGLSGAECENMYIEADLNKDGVIQYKEFVAWLFDDAPKQEKLPGESSTFMRCAFEQFRDFIAKGILNGPCHRDRREIKQEFDVMEKKFVKFVGMAFDSLDDNGEGTLFKMAAHKLLSNWLSEHSWLANEIAAILALSTKQQAKLPRFIKETHLTRQIIAVESDYWAHKAERDSAAFEFIEKFFNYMGTISKDHFVEILTPGTDYFKQLMKIRDCGHCSDDKFF